MKAHQSEYVFQEGMKTILSLYNIELCSDKLLRSIEPITTVVKMHLLACVLRNTLNHKTNNYLINRYNEICKLN